jgi:hypothetical protein
MASLHKLKLLICWWNRAKHTRSSTVDPIYIWQFQPSAPWMKAVTLDLPCSSTKHYYNISLIATISFNKYASLQCSHLSLSLASASFWQYMIYGLIVFSTFKWYLLTDTALCWCNSMTQSSCYRNRRLVGYTPYSVSIHYNFFYVLLTVHLDDLCNENQLDALFTLNLFRQSTSTCFGHVYCPS